eukprot:1725301-Pleurochrysis_carterae.AAC.1
MRRSIAEIQASMAEISELVEQDLSDFKRRWSVTAARLEGLPTELPNLKSLADVRMYVADTIFAGDVPALIRKSGGRRALSNETGGAGSSGGESAADGANVSRVGAGGGEGVLGELGANGRASTLEAGQQEDGTWVDPLGVHAVNEDEAGAVLRPTPASDLRLPGRKITIVTTAALPWMTGTSVNPLLRAAHLVCKGYDVTLMLPWLPPAEQDLLFPKGLRFERPAQQEAYAEWWLLNRANLEVPTLKIVWFEAQYEKMLGCIIQERARVWRCKGGGRFFIARVCWPASCHGVPEFKCMIVRFSSSLLFVASFFARSPSRALYSVLL